MKELEQVEQELADLRQRLEQSLDVLDNLSQVQIEFENLAKTHQQLRSNSSGDVTRDDFEHLEIVLHDRFAQFEQQIQTTKQDIWGALAIAQQELKNADTMLATEVEQQFDQLTQDIDARLNQLRNEWMAYRQNSSDRKLEAFAETVEGNLRSEVQAAIDQIAQLGLNQNQVERLELLDGRTQKIKSSLLSIDRRVLRLRNWLALTMLVSLGAIALSLILNFPSSTP